MSMVPAFSVCSKLVCPPFLASVVRLVVMPSLVREPVSMVREPVFCCPPAAVSVTRMVPSTVAAVMDEVPSPTVMSPV